MDKPYKTWHGRKVTNGREVFIETDSANWAHRLSTWKSLTYQDPDCPCPMPKGHVMFLNYGSPGSYYKPVV